MTKEIQDAEVHNLSLNSQRYLKLWAIWPIWFIFFLRNHTAPCTLRKVLKGMAVIEDGKGRTLILTISKLQMTILPQVLKKTTERLDLWLNHLEIWGFGPKEYNVRRQLINLWRRHEPFYKETMQGCQHF